MISMSDPVALTRRDAARSELDAAIRNFFLEEDLVAAHLLGWAALDVISDVAKAWAKNTLRDAVARKLPPEMAKAWRKAERDHYNFMKHANRDPDRSIQLSPEMTAFVIQGACRDYHLV
jgi:hypothetical protein